MRPVYSYLKQTNVLSIIAFMYTHYQLSFGFNEPDGGVTEFVPADHEKWFIALWGEHLRVCGAKQDGYVEMSFTRIVQVVVAFVTVAPVVCYIRHVVLVHMNR